MQPTNTQGIANYAFSNEAKRWRDRRTGRFAAESTVVSEMERHVNATFDALNGLTGQLYDGRITLEQWQVSVAEELKDAHLAQSMFAVGGKQNMGAAEYGRVGGALRDEYGYLRNFAQDIADGNVSRAQAQARIRQYGRATKQSYWREYREASDGLIEWQLNPAEHCPECLELTANSPYRPEDLPTVPGAGDTTCRGNCKCTLSRRTA